MFVGARAKSATAGDLCEMVELPQHPWFFGCQFHPEFTSNPRRGHPLFISFVQRGARAAAAHARRARARRRLSPSSSRPLDRRSDADEALRLRGRARPASVPHRRSLRGRIAAAADRRRRRAEGDLRRRSAMPVHLQVVVRQGQPQLATRRFADPAWRRACAVLAEVQAADRRAGADRRAHGRRGRRRRPPWSTCCRRRHSCAGRPISSRRSPRAGKPVNIKKGQFLAPEDMQQVVAKAQGGERHRQHPGLRARRVVRLSQPRLRHALAGDHARHRLPGRVRRDAFGAACRAGRARRAAASANSFRCWRARRWPRAWPACSWRRIRDPEKALSDGPNAWPLARMRALLETLMALDATVKRAGFPENELMAAPSA